MFPPAVSLGAALIGAMEDLSVGPVRAVMLVGWAVVVLLGLLVQGMAGMVQVVDTRRRARWLPRRVGTRRLCATCLLGKENEWSDNHSFHQNIYCFHSSNILRTKFATNIITSTSVVAPVGSGTFSRIRNYLFRIRIQQE